MSKDPAVLFYTSDFLTGTMTMSDEHAGMYIRLLCLQHQKGRLTEADMLYICKTYVKDVFSKFLKDDGGYFYNKRMEDETYKRHLYSDSRRKNVLSRYKKKRLCNSTYVEHMENENENENKVFNKELKSISSNTNINKERFTPPTVDQVKEYCITRNNSVNPERFVDFYASKGWMIGKNKMKDWQAAIRTWEKGENGGSLNDVPENLKHLFRNK